MYELLRVYRDEEAAEVNAVTAEEDADEDSSLLTKQNVSKCPTKN